MGFRHLVAHIIKKSKFDARIFKLKIETLHLFSSLYIINQNFEEMFKELGIQVKYKSKQAF